MTMRFGCLALALAIFCITGLSSVGLSSAKAEEIRCPDRSTRLRRDCSAETQIFEGRLSSLRERAGRLPRRQGLRAAVVDAVAALALGRAQLCQDYNVCDVAVAAHGLRLALIEREATALARLLDSQSRGQRDAAAGLSAWASGLAGRLSAAASAATPSAMNPAAPAAPRVTEGVLRSLRMLDAVIESTQRSVALLTRAMDLLDRRQADGSPQLCVDSEPIHAQLRSFVREGSQGSYLAQGLADAIARVCDPYLRWRLPTADDRERITRLLVRVTALAERIRSAGDCTQASDWSRECSRAYGREAEAGRLAVASGADALAKIRAAVHGLATTPRMTCSAPIWGQLTSATRIPGRVASDARRVGVEARRICQNQHMWPLILERQEESLRTAAESWLASSAEAVRSTRATRARLRATFHIHD